MALHASVARASALLLGLASAWACSVSNNDDECPQGSDGCACAFGFCDDGLTCMGDVCVADGTSTEHFTTLGSETTPQTSGELTDPTTEGDGGSSSESTDADDDSSSSGEAPPTDPIYQATVDGIPTDYLGDAHAYSSPAGRIIVRGVDSFGAEMLLRIPPGGPGTYACILDETTPAIYYTQDGAIGPIEMSTRTSGVCSITVDTLGEVGEYVSGSFEGLVVFPGAMEIPPVMVSSGTFNVIRTPDEG